MTTAEKLLRAKQDFDDVYSAGFEAGKGEGGELPAWTQNLYNVRFGSDDWAEEETTLYFPNLTDMTNMFNNIVFSKIKTLTIRSDVPVNLATQAFFSAQGVKSSLEKLILYCDFSQCTNFNNWLMRQTELISIEGNPFDFSSANGLSAVFSYTNKLQSFRVVPNTIKVSFDIRQSYALDDSTIQSVIDGLSDLTDSDACTLKLHATVIAKLTDEQLTQIAQKNWNVA